MIVLAITSGVMFVVGITGLVVFGACRAAAWADQQENRLSYLEHLEWEQRAREELGL